MTLDRIYEDPCSAFEFLISLSCDYDISPAPTPSSHALRIILPSAILLNMLI